MTNDTLEKTTLLDIDKLQAEMREAHRLLNAHGMGHYWTCNLDAFTNSVLVNLKKRV
jgi:hypothetical protein